MAIWETEDEYSGPAAASLPTPTDTPYRTPSRNSRRSRRSVTPPGKGSPPPPVPGDRSSKRSSRDINHDDSISVLDPRRFTPTLHANLVSEILSLRRDQEGKTKIIESLETSLQTAQEEHDAAHSSYTTVSKENRSLKRQLALLEGGTSSALGELARERDDAVESAVEIKKRLDAAQKKLKSQEDDSERTHNLWAKEKDSWDEERRKFERKIHVAESRLRMVLDEVAAYQAAQMNSAHNGADSDAEEGGNDNDAASVRTMSMTNSIRFSTATGGSPSKMNGNSLADELNFDGEDDYMMDPDGRESVLSNHRHIRNTSRDSALSRIHRRNQSIESLIRPGSVARGRMMINHSVLDRLEGGMKAIDGIKEDDETQPPAPRVSYTDAGVQFSPPPSPKLTASKPSSPEPPVIMTARAEKFQECESPSRVVEIEANQRRKRVSIVPPLTVESPLAPPTNVMVSAGSQTSDEALAPPKPPKSPLRSTTPPPGPKLDPTMVSVSSQTDPPPLQPTFFPPIPQVPIPAINLQPPSRPTTPKLPGKEPRLPQYFREMGTQVSLLKSTSAASASVAVQTEEIRIDTRLDKLPAHLHPSAISSRPVSPVPPPPETAEDRHFTPVPGNLPPRNPRRLKSQQSVADTFPSSPPSSPPVPKQTDTNDIYPGNNDDGPLSSHKAPMRRPHRISSLFAGFDGGSSDEVDEFGDTEVSDSEFRTALSAPQRPKSGPIRPSKRSSTETTANAATASPEQLPASRLNSARHSMRPIGTETYSSFNLPDKQSRDTIGRRPSTKGTSYGMGASNRSSIMRKAAMIQSGIASHQGRARSPSLPDPRDPPFPIPTRASSRKVPLSASAPSDGQRSPTRGTEAWHRRGARNGHYRANSIRKVRSAAALPRNQRNRRQGSRSPPPFPPSAETPESPGLPPLPDNDITTPGMRNSYAKYRPHRPQNSTTTANTDNSALGSLGNANQATGVVDAIAQTMVGEWMFKYVRRRKSFGVPESNGKDDNSNDRHKRWVWLAPYERSILWSSKQPSSGTALMGKPGRKLTIQSVLDVKDDNPPPKGMGPLFNRSILILTPQRALKFTAVSAERHYLWLTSLSFLAHSSQAVPEIMQVTSPKPAPEFDAPPPPPKAKRNAIRDSIRLTKSKTAMIRTAPVSVASSQTGDIPSISSFPLPDLPESFVSMPSIPNLPAGTHSRELSREAAEPPLIPRFNERMSTNAVISSNAMVHGRKRSNTGGHVPPPLSFRGFSGPVSGGGGSSSSYHAATNSTAGASTGTAGSSDVYATQSQTGSSSQQTWGMSTAGSVRTSEASSRPSNFFDAIGTVRMEAFISPLAFSKFDDYPDEHEELRFRARRRSKEARRRASRSRHRDSYNSRGTRGTDDFFGGSRAGSDDFFKDDPFRGF